MAPRGLPPAVRTLGRVVVLIRFSIWLWLVPLLAACSSPVPDKPTPPPDPDPVLTRQQFLRQDSLRADSIAKIRGTLPGAVLPKSRIVAYYGNPLHRRMGVLGEYPKDEMLRRLAAQVAAWQALDPQRPVRPALHLTAVVAQRDAGADGQYRELLPDSVIRRVIGWAREQHALVFLDVQPGLSPLTAELPRLVPYLRLPFVHLGLDPEFAMHASGGQPGRKIGELDAVDVNYARRFLADLVSEYHLPPKILIIHRFRQDMLTNYQQIRLDPRVQIVVDMDGWGTPGIKRGSYRKFIAQEPVEFAGFKLFYKNDQRPGSRLMTPAEVAALRPAPVYIQYQ